LGSSHRRKKGKARRRIVASGSSMGTPLAREDRLLFKRRKIRMRQGHRMSPTGFGSSNWSELFDTKLNYRKQKYETKVSVSAFQPKSWGGGCRGLGNARTLASHQGKKKCAGRGREGFTLELGNVGVGGERKFETTY